MTEYVWSSVRKRAVDCFRGEMPKAETEAAILEVFELMPLAVVNAIERVAKGVEGGRIRSGWAILRAELQGVTEPTRELVVQDSSKREKAIGDAERWLRASGIHFDRSDEVEDELFGERGLLQTWAGDALLKRRMLSRWEAVRPLGEQVEREAAEASRQYIEWRKQMGEKKRAPVVSP